MIAPSVPSYRPTDDNGQALDLHSDCGGASNAVTDDWWECYIDFDGGSGQHADSPGSSIEDITTSNTELDGLGSSSPFTTSPRSRYHCTYPGCDKDYARESGRKRHMLSHDPLPRFSCDFPSCSRFGADGFTRKDKFNDHKKLIAARDQISIVGFGTTPLVARETQYFISFRNFYSYQWMLRLVV